MPDNDTPSVSEFETAVWHGDNQSALELMLHILRDISSSGGKTPPVGPVDRVATGGGERPKVFATRFAAAVSELMSRPTLEIDERMFVQLMMMHRWLSLVFAASSFEDSDFVIARAGIGTTKEGLEAATIPELRKLCLLYSAESKLPISFAELFQVYPSGACNLAIGILSSRFLGSMSAHQKREVLLKWMPEALEKLTKLDGLTVQILVDLWMHSSYGLIPEKHDLKRPLNRLIRNQIADRGISEPKLIEKTGHKDKPCVFVILEWFHKTHSIMRTHSLSMRTLKEHYKLVGFGPKGMVDDVGKAVFDEYFQFDDYSPDLGFLKPVIQEAEKQNPVAVYYPSVGMGLHTLFLINLRLAKKQFMALGHPATTHSDKIDFVLVEEDYVGDEELFSETLLKVPKSALPYFRPTVELVDRPKKKSAPIKIAVPTAIMKLNPVLLDAFRQVTEKAQHAVEFHFLLGGTPSLLHQHALTSIRKQLPNSVVYGTTPVNIYLQNVNACDLFANPFPFGNTNGIVDTVYCNLPGVCLIGEEVHARIDKGMFERMKFPDWCITYNVDDYVDSIVKLVDDAGLRTELSNNIRDLQMADVLYEGNPELFCVEFNKALLQG